MSDAQYDAGVQLVKDVAVVVDSLRQPSALAALIRLSGPGISSIKIEDAVLGLTKSDNQDYERENDLAQAYQILKQIEYDLSMAQSSATIDRHGYARSIRAAMNIISKES
jgi:hypothetical protein